MSHESPHQSAQEIPPGAVVALDAPPRTRPASYPVPFAARRAGGEKRPLVNSFGLSNFGVNLTRLVSGSGR